MFLLKKLKGFKLNFTTRYTLLLLLLLLISLFGIHSYRVFHDHSNRYTFYLNHDNFAQFKLHKNVI